MVDDNLLRIDIGAIKESLKLKVVRSVKWIPGTKQLADCLTKAGDSYSKLLQIIQDGRLINMLL